MAMGYSGSLPAGTRVNDRYELVALLGSGSNGEVYEAFDEHLGIEVALKLLNPVGGQPAAWDEAQILEQLRSDFLLPVFNADVVVGGDIRFIATRVMKGGDLEAAAAPNGVTSRQASRWGQQLAHGLERVHSAGLLHRDVKPGNAYLDEAQNVLLGDLGMAIRRDMSGRSAPDGTIVTVAPEALVSEGAHCSVSSDIFSLAATVFYLMSGEYPVDHRLKRAAIRDKVLVGDFRRLRDLAPHVSLGVAAVVERSLSLRPEGRHASALDLANALVAANHYKRDWTRVASHDGHSCCFKGVSTKSAQAIFVCVSVMRSGKFSIRPSYESGRGLRKFESDDISPASLSASLRRVIAEISKG
jgi:serine/threonine protein kinase